VSVGLGRLVARRVALVVPALFAVSVITFVLLRVLPTDPAARLAGPFATTRVKDEIRHSLQLDKPLPVQYVAYLGSLVHGDLGLSVHTGRPITADLESYWPFTAELAGASLTLAIVVGLITGMATATRRDSVIDRVLRVATIAGLSVPEFLLGLILVYILYFRIPIFPAPTGAIGVDVPLPPHITGMQTIDGVLSGDWAAVGSSALYLTLPAVTLGLILACPVARITRAVMIDILASDYIRAARSYGVSPVTVTWKYALKNALPSLLNLIGVLFGYLLGGTVLVETVFSRPGLGRYAVDSIQAGDFAAIQGFVLLATVSYIAVNLLVDVGAIVIDKRAA
jgi:ABC-type dipeptide/oligopeptide/nickel transport system permease component